MKAKVKINLYSTIISNLGTFNDWGPIAEKVVRYLNSDLAGEYPSVFFFMETRVKGEATIYAGSKENMSYKNDPQFTEVLTKYDPEANFSGDYKNKRRKGS